MAVSYCGLGRLPVGPCGYLWLSVTVRGARAQVRRALETGREELVVVGGYYSSVLAEMTPFTLDLGTFYWRCWPGVPEAAAPSLGQAPDQAPEQALPAPRQRMAAQRVTEEWMLVSGGSPASVRTPPPRSTRCSPSHAAFPAAARHACKPSSLACSGNAAFRSPECCSCMCLACTPKVGCAQHATLALVGRRPRTGQQQRIGLEGVFSEKGLPG